MGGAVASWLVCSTPERAVEEEGGGGGRRRGGGVGGGGGGGGAFVLLLGGMLVHGRSLSHNLLGSLNKSPVPIYTPGWREALWIVLPKNTTQCRRPGLESGLLVPGTSTSTTRPPRLPVYIDCAGYVPPSSGTYVAMLRMTASCQGPHSHV